MKKQDLKSKEAIIEGQDFADPKAEQKEKPSSHGETANQKDGDFSELEESRMEHPPKHRDDNGSDKSDTDDPQGSVSQQDGVK
ncbi:hypothetical protein [Pedobacter nototheniae]|uniref:hypothetical protein n=1 Tax=Pedobacter nototheniae TaxID=2488994 RepID=UPI0029305DFD|nr:hypothetical protein [Pedobacter nototheniae]